MGENNYKAMVIKLGIKEREDQQFGMGVLPAVEDVRSNDQIAEKFPSSLEIRKAMAYFLRTCLGLNNKIPRTLQEALAEGPDKWTPIEPEFIWPEAHTEENDDPIEESGTYNTITIGSQNLIDFFYSYLMDIKKCF